MWGSSTISNPFAPKPFGGQTGTSSTTSSNLFGTSSGFGSASATPQSSAFGTTNNPFGSVSSTATTTGAATMGFGSFSTPSTAPLSGSSSSSPFSKFAASTTSSSGGQTICFGPQRKGSRVTPYTTTDLLEAGSGNKSSNAPELFKLHSISAMPAYTDSKSHEELRLEDYQLGDKGGRIAAATPTFVQPSSNPFSTSTTTQSNPFAPKPSTTQTIPFVPSSNPFSTFTAPSTFTSSASTTPTSGTASTSPGTQFTGLFQSTTPSKTSIWNTNSVLPSYPNLFQTTTQPTLTSPTPVLLPSNNQPTSLHTTQPPQTPSPLTTNNQLSPFQTPQPAQTPSQLPMTNPFQPAQTSLTPWPRTTNFQPTVSSNPFQTPHPAQTSLATPSLPTTKFQPTVSSNPFQTPQPAQTSLTPSPLTTNFQPTISPNPFQTPQPTQTSLTPSSLTTAPNPFQTPQPAHTSLTPSSNNQPSSLNTAFQTIQSAQTSLTPSVLPTNNQPNSFTNTFQTTQTATVEQLPNLVVLQPTSPFGTLPAMPKISIGCSVSSPTTQYGISSMPVIDKPVLTRASSLLLTSRCLARMRIGSTVRKYHPKNDSPKVAFYCDDESPWTPEADALFVLPRENPRTLVIRQKENWLSNATSEKPSVLNSTHASLHHNSGLVDNGSKKEHIRCAQRSETSNGGLEDEEANIEAVMPKLKSADYYTEPRIQELAAKERAEPGFCQHVKNFVVGRQGYGSVKFAGETDVRGLDLESVVQFNHREVIVYLDDEEKPPVGQGLNKPAEVTLLNIKCYDKKTGQQYTEGPKLEKYKEMLMKKAQEQGAEFVSYEPLKGKWRFRVKHFS